MKVLALCIGVLCSFVWSGEARALDKLEHVEQTAISFVPVLYVSPRPDHPDADQQLLYSATVCDGKLYHGNLTAVHVNMPFGWDVITGRYAKLEVCDTQDCAKIHCSNWEKGRFNGYHYCNFTYNATTMGDLVLRVTAGPSPNNVWTAAVEFVSKKDWDPPKPVVPREYWGLMEEPRGKGEKYATAVTVLIQIVKTATQQTVITLKPREFYFRFCPDNGTGSRFDVTVTVVGVDSKSAMSTYVCLPSELPCSPASSTHYDPRGTSINSVTLTTGSSGLTELHVLVVGWGDSEQTNTFELGATLKKMT